MIRSALAIALAIGALVPAAASARARVAIDQRDHAVTDTVTASFFPERAAPSGWHHTVALLFEDTDEDGEGCAQFLKRNAYFGRRPFSMRFRPSAATIPAGGADQWCYGRARIGLYIQRNGQPDRLKARAVSRWMYFSD